MKTKRFLYKVTFLAVFSLCFYQLSSAQSFTNYRYGRNVIVSGATGMAAYFGDLSNPGQYFDDKMNLGVGIEYQFIDRFSLMSNLIYYRIAGSDEFANDEGRMRRNLSFRSDNFEFSVAAKVSLFPKNDRYFRRAFFNPYGFIGIGFTTVNPKAELDGEWYRLRPLQTERVRYSAIAMVIPMGLGASFKISNDLNISIEGGIRFTNTDYLDDVSSRLYPSPSEFDDPNGIAARLSKRGDVSIRGNPENDDGYFLLNIKLEYYLPVDFDIFKGRARSTSQRKLYRYRLNRNYKRR